MQKTRKTYKKPQIQAMDRETAIKKDPRVKWIGYGMVEGIGNKAKNIERERKPLPPEINEEELKKRKVTYDGEIVMRAGVVHLFTLTNPELKADRTTITVEGLKGEILSRLDKKLQLIYSQN